MDLEELVTSPLGFGLTTASIPQRAVCRIMTGVPLGSYAKDPNVIQMLGGPEAVAMLPNVAPAEIVFGAAVRCAKSTIVAAKALRNAFLGDCSGLAPSEIPRVPIVSVDLDKAKETFSKLEGALTTSPELSKMLLDVKADSVLIRSDSGWPVEIKMIAGSRAGNTLVSRWCLGAIFDEAPRMQGQSDGIINLPDARTAIIARMRKGAQIDMVGSLWAPSGLVYKLVTEHFGKPTADLVVLIATGPMLRPDLYTPEYCEDIKRKDDRTYECDVMARFADPESALLPSVDIAAAFRPDDAQQNPEPYHNYLAVMDPATRGNGWTLTLLTCTAPDRYSVALAVEWIGSRSEPLRPSTVLREMSELLTPFGVFDVWTDQHGYDFLTDIADLANTGLTFHLCERDDDTSSKMLLRLIEERRLSLPRNRTLQADLIAIKRRPRQGGGSIIVLPLTADGRHCDYAASLLLAMGRLPEAPSVPVVSTMTEDERIAVEFMEQRYGRTAADRLAGEFEAA